MASRRSSIRSELLPSLAAAMLVGLRCCLPGANGSMSYFFRNRRSLAMLRSSRRGVWIAVCDLACRAAQPSCSGTRLPLAGLRSAAAAAGVLITAARRLAAPVARCDLLQRRRVCGCVCKATIIHCCITERAAIHRFIAKQMNVVAALCHRFP